MDDDMCLLGRLVRSDRLSLCYEGNTSIHTIKCIFRTASVPSLSNIRFIAWMAASAHSPNLAHVRNGTAASFISSLMVQLIAVPTILRNTSPTPICLLPGFLSRGMSRDDT